MRRQIPSGRYLQAEETTVGEKQAGAHFCLAQQWSGVAKRPVNLNYRVWRFKNPFQS